MKPITASEIEKQNKLYLEQKQKEWDTIWEPYYDKMIEAINRILDKKK